MFSRQITRLSLNLSKIPSCSYQPIGIARNVSFSVCRRQEEQRKMLSEEQLKITKKASERLKEILDDGERLRVEVDGGGCSGFEYKIKLDKGTNSDDLFWKCENGAEIVVDELSLGYMKGATVDFVEDLMKASFRIVNNPVAEKGCSCGSSFALKMD